MGPNQQVLARGEALELALSHAEYVDLYRLKYAEFVRLSGRIVLSKSIAEELVQDVFRKVWETRSRLDPDRVSHYIATLVINESYDHAKKSATERRSLAKLGLRDLIPVQRDGSADIGALLTSADHATQLLRHLPAKQRAVVVLRVFEDMSEASVAKALAISEGSVKTHYSRGLASLRQALAGELSAG